MNKNSLFMVIEGLDGSGKTSVTRYISNILDKENHGKVKLTFEPHDPSCAGLFIRQVLMKKIRNFSPKILALAFAANRLDHCDREINPWLSAEEGAIIRLFLDDIRQKKYTVKEKLPWTELDAYELEYELPGNILLSGVALIIQEKQRYDIILKKAPDIPTMSDFMFVFSPGPAELVTNYYERAIIKYNADTIREGLFPSTKLITQKDLAYRIWSTAKKMQ